jgi:hypothetical protein
MEKIILKVENSENVIFLEELLKNYHFLKEIKTNNKKKDSKRNIPIQWATEVPVIEEITNIITDRKLDLTEIRKNA